MNKALVSVIVPVYHVENLLGRCIESIICQTYENIEILLIDDGSDDNCPKICDNYAQKDKRISVYHKINGGLSDARNYGIDRAKGDYLVFVDSDDYISSNMVETLLDTINQNNSDIAICPYLYVDENGNTLNWQKDLVIEGVFNREEIFHFYNKSNVSWILGVAWNKMYKNQLFSKIRYPVGKLHEDDYISFLIYEKAERIAIINQRMYYYTQRNTSIMGNKLNVKHADGAEALLNRIEFAERTNRRFLIPKAENLAFSILFSLSIRSVSKNELKYLKPIVKRYRILYRRIKSECNLSLKQIIKRNILFSDGWLLKISKYIRNGINGEGKSKI